MTSLEKYRWEATHIIVIAGVVTTLILGTWLFGDSRGNGLDMRTRAVLSSKYAPVPSAVTAQPIQSDHAAQMSLQQGEAVAQQPDPRQVTVGASGISNRYTLLRVDRRTASSKSDELVIKLHVESLAMENLASPFESDMLDVTSEGLQPIKPSTPFRFPVPSGTTRDQEIVFGIPPGLDLNHATLRIHYYNYQGEIPLNRAPAQSVLGRETP